ncbi:MAG: cytochrome b/b6 domain-containing protein [Gloeocapsa sp. DLM2.Bin57]|nr:MAG: cytochrome b/b6 domain-containing protein [Gloeocapsa sp. DLM2.Bin57]
MKPSLPYQPLILRILHGLNGIFVILAIITAFWTYDTYDGRWGRINLPKYEAIEGIHGTFGLWALLVFPLLVIYVFRRGHKKLIQSDFVPKISHKIGQPLWWYTLHRLVNTSIIFALSFALFSGKMMSEKWLPQGELNHFWYYAHLLSWLIMVLFILLHLLMIVKIGSTPLLLSIIDWHFRPVDNPRHWQIRNILSRTSSNNLFKLLEGIVLIIILAAWVISWLK